MVLRECAAGVLGSLQSTSHQNVKLKLRLPEGSPAKFVKISGALQTTKRAAGRDAEASLGNLHFGDKRDILVQLVIDPDNTQHEQAPQDAWESIVSGLEALGGPLDSDDQRVQSVEEIPLVQADLSYGDLLRDGTTIHLATTISARDHNATRKSTIKKWQTRDSSDPTSPDDCATKDGTTNLRHAESSADSCFPRSTRSSKSPSEETERSLRDSEKVACLHCHQTQATKGTRHLSTREAHAPKHRNTGVIAALILTQAHQLQEVLVLTLL